MLEIIEEYGMSVLVISATLMIADFLYKIMIIL